jgi:deoxyribodipyrimidine photolyase-related protein
VKTGPQACPLTTFYWDFLDRHDVQLRHNPRTALMVRPLDKWSQAEREALRSDARRKRASIDTL